MSLQDRILMRKIRKREAHKLNIIKKVNQEQLAQTKSEDIEELNFKRKAEDEYIKKKKKKKSKDDQTDETSSNHPEENTLESEEIVPCAIDQETTPEADNKLPTSSSDLEILSSCTFDSLKDRLCEKSLKAIKEMGFTKLTEIQARSILPLLEGKDLVGAAKTGSGKTLAFLVPAVELIYKLEFKPRNGTGVIIISPTRELSLQTFGVLKELMKYHYHTFGLIMGGANRQSEAQKLSKGCNILVATPGRLIDHMQNTPDFMYKNLQCLVIDEADRILEIGFEEQLAQIINLLPKRRQTMLFSATQNKKTEALSSLAFKKEPVYVGVDDSKEAATVLGLEQGYMLVPSEKRLQVLYTFLKKRKSKKVMVFFSSCMSVKFHYLLFNYIDLPVMSIHGDQKQKKRLATLFQFCRVDTGILLCTDVAARGLDIPAVDWIVQYDPPDDPKDYIHRVGRTARGEGSSGHAVMILRPEEMGVLWYLQQAKIPIKEFLIDWTKVHDIQLQIEGLVGRNFVLNKSAKDAFKAYLRSYDSHRLKSIFDIDKLDLAKVGKSFGFRVPPQIDLRCQQHVNKSGKKKRAGDTNINI